MVLCTYIRTYRCIDHDLLTKCMWLQSTHVKLCQSLIVEGVLMTPNQFLALHNSTLPHLETVQYSVRCIKVPMKRIFYFINT